MIADRRSRFKMLTNPGSGGLRGFFETTKGQKRQPKKGQRPTGHWTKPNAECRLQMMLQNAPERREVQKRRATVGTVFEGIPLGVLVAVDFSHPI